MIVILLFTYRSPILWILPIFSAVVAYIVSTRRGLPAGQVRRPHGQRAEPGDPRHPGDRRRHRLRAAARGPLSRGAAPPRGPARGDGLRPAPRRSGDPGQRRDGRRRHAAACRSRSINSTAGLGPVLRRRHRASRFLGRWSTLLPALLVDLRPLDLLAEASPTFGSARADQTGFWAKVGSADRAAPAAVWMVTAGLLLVACLGLFTPRRHGLSTEDTYTKEFDSINGQQILVDHGLVDTSNTVQVVANADEVDGRRRRDRPTSTASARSRRARSIEDGARFVIAATHGRHLDPTAAFDIVEDVPRRRARRRRRRRPGRRRLGVLPRHQDRLEPRQQGDHPDRPAGGLPDPDRCCCGPWRRR